MIGDHVSERAGLIIVAAASFHADCFRNGDLHVIDVAAVPDRLENTVAETKREDVLHGFFAEIVIDSINLIFLKNMLDFLIERTGGIQSVAERFFVDNTAPVIGLLPGELRFAKPARDFAKITGSGSQVVEIIPGGEMLGVDFSQQVTETFVGIGILEIPEMVVETVRKPVQKFGFDRSGGEFFQFSSGLLAKIGARNLMTADSDNGKFPRKEAVFCQIVECRHELALGEISADAKNHHDARACGASCLGGRRCSLWSD